MPRNRGVDPVIDYLGSNLGNEECVRNALEHLAELTKDDAPEVDSMSKKIILRAMNDYISETDIQIAGCNILNNLMVTGTFFILLRAEKGIIRTVYTHIYLYMSTSHISRPPDFDDISHISCSYIAPEVIVHTSQMLEFESILEC